MSSWVEERVGVWKGVDGGSCYGDGKVGIYSIWTI